MKKKLLIWTLFLTSWFLNSCGLYVENERVMKHTSADGEVIDLALRERHYPLTKKRLLIYVYKNPLAGRDCKDAGLKTFKDDLWTEVVRQNDLSELEAATFFLYKGQINSATPGFCDYSYSKKSSGEWISED